MEIGFVLLIIILGKVIVGTKRWPQSLAHTVPLNGLQMISFPDVGHIPLKAGWVPSESGA